MDSSKMYLRSMQNLCWTCAWTVLHDDAKFLPSKTSARLCLTLKEKKTRLKYIHCVFAINARKHSQYGGDINVHLICRSLFGHSIDLFCRFTRVYEGHFMLNYKEEVELSDRGLHDFRCYFACRFEKFDTSVTSHVFMYCLGSLLLQNILLSLHVFAFEGQNMKFTMNMFGYCTCIRILCCDAGPGYN